MPTDGLASIVEFPRLGASDDAPGKKTPGLRDFAPARWRTSGIGSASSTVSKSSHQAARSTHWDARWSGRLGDWARYWRACLPSLTRVSSSPSPKTLTRSSNACGWLAPSKRHDL